MHFLSINLVSVWWRILCSGTYRNNHLKEAHLKINELLKEFSSRNKEKVILADLASEVFLPRDKRLWGDPTHFNKQGYDKMADVIYNAMKEHVWASQIYISAG